MIKIRALDEFDIMMVFGVCALTLAEKWETRKQTLTIDVYGCVSVYLFF